MALTRKLLKGMGLTEEQVDTIIEAHTDSVNAVKEERDTFKEKADKYDSASKELESLREAAKSGDGGTVPKADYDALKKEYDDYKSDITAKETKTAKERAFREILKAEGVSEKRIDAIVRASSKEIDEIEIGEDGKAKDGAKLSEFVKSEWSDFIVSTSAKGAPTATPPANNANSNSKTKEEILAISDGFERRKAMAENPQLFGIETN